MMGEKILVLYDQALVLLNLVSVVPANRHHETSADLPKPSRSTCKWKRGVTVSTGNPWGKYQVRNTSSSSRRAVGFT